MVATPIQISTLSEISTLIEMIEMIEMNRLAGQCCQCDDMAIVSPRPEWLSLTMPDYPLCLSCLKDEEENHEEEEE